MANPYGAPYGKIENREMHELSGCPGTFEDYGPKYETRRDWTTWGWDEAGGWDEAATATTWMNLRMYYCGVCKTYLYW